MKPPLDEETGTSRATLKTYFITGVVILLPLALTLAIVSFIFNLLTEPFIGIMKSVFEKNNLIEYSFLFLSADQVQQYTSQLLILILLFFSTVGLGFIARWFFIHYLIRAWENLVARIPFIRSLYKTCQDIIQTLFTSSSNSFKQVVMAPFPSKDSRVIGLVTRDNIPSVDESSDVLVAVFIPTTPNPTSGYLLLFKKNDLIYLDMKVEEALKYIISCGVIPTPIKVLKKTKTPSP